MRRKWDDQSVAHIEALNFSKNIPATNKQSCKCASPLRWTHLQQILPTVQWRQILALVHGWLKSPFFIPLLQTFAQRYVWTHQFGVTCVSLSALNKNRTLNCCNRLPIAVPTLTLPLQTLNYCHTTVWPVLELKKEIQHKLSGTDISFFNLTKCIFAAAVRHMTF